MKKRGQMTRTIKNGAVALLWTAAAAAWAQTDMRGHWSGSLDTPNGPVAIEVDLDEAASGWIGSVSIPAQGVNGLPLDAIAFTDGKASFHFKGVPGDPKVEVSKASPSVAQRLVGTWEGTLPVGSGLRIVLTISNGKAGAEATMVSVDQGNAQIPVAGIWAERREAEPGPKSGRRRL